MFHCEISEAKRSDGRRRVKLVLHEIHQDRNHYNKNGISYNEQYVRDNADSIIGMPICATFLDNEKDIPYDHGMTGQDGNMPLFENSVQVGSADGWSIEDIQINGEKHKVLIAEGYINQQRYPHFVEWLENKINDARLQYNSRVTTFNNLVESVPSNIVAKTFGFEKQELFKANEDEKQNINVSL